MPAALARAKPEASVLRSLPGGWRRLSARQRREAERLIADPKVKKAIHWFASWLCPRDRGTSAEDLRQVGMLAAAASVATFDPSFGAAPQSWAITQAKGWMQNTWRQCSQYQIGLRIEQAASWVLGQAKDESSADSDHQETEDMARWMDALTEREERLFRAYALDDRTFASISLDEHVSAERVRQIVARAREKLRRAVGCAT